MSDQFAHWPTPPVVLSEAQMEQIADKAAEKAVEKVMNHMYQEVGKRVLSRVMWLLGVATVALLVWLTSHGIVKP